MSSSLLPFHPESQSPGARQDVRVFLPKAISGVWIVLTAGGCERGGLGAPALPQHMQL